MTNFIHYHKILLIILNVGAGKSRFELSWIPAKSQMKIDYNWKIVTDSSKQDSKKIRRST